jgi:hypothetical protein
VYRPGAVLATVLTTLVLTSTASADSFCVGPRNGKKLRPGLDPAGTTHRAAFRIVLR